MRIPSGMTITVEGKEYFAIDVLLQEKHLLLIRGNSGYVMCGYLKIQQQILHWMDSDKYELNYVEYRSNLWFFLPALS